MPAAARRSPDLVYRMSTRDSNPGPRPRVLVASMLKQYLHQTAKAFNHRTALCGYWVSNANITSVERSLYRRIWPYHLLKKPFYHLPFPQLEELTRFWFAPAYDAWIGTQKLPADCNAVMGLPGSCEALFRLADKQKRRVLKIFDSPNSHPRLYARLWQEECDRFMPGYRIPFPRAALERAAREVDQADLVLCPSDFVRDSMLAQGVPAAKCHVRHFGVDTSIFTPRQVIPETPVFVCAGSVCLRKGHQYLFRAFAKLKEAHPHARLICLGGLRPDFAREWPAWRGTVEHHPFMGHQDLAALLKTATAFVLASVEEGFARVLSEAMAAGLPIIATRQTGVTTVLEDEKQGLVVPARDVDALHHAMGLLATDRDMNRRMGEAAVRAGAVRNTWQDYGDNLLDRFSRELASP